MGCERGREWFWGEGKGGGEMERGWEGGGGRKCRLDLID